MSLYYWFIIIYLVLLTVLSVRKIKWAIYLIIFALPSYLIRFSVGWLPMTVLEGMILITFVIWFVKALKHESIKTLKQIILKYKYLFIFCGLFLLSATVAIWVGPDLRMAAGLWKAYFVEPVLFFIMAISVLKKEDIKNILKIFFFQIIVLSFIAVYQKITGNLIFNPFWAAEATRRVTGVFEYPNALALYLAPLIMVFIGWWGFKVGDKTETRRELLNAKNCLLVIGFGVAVIYFTGSKGALLGVLAGIIFYAIFYQRYRKYFIGILLIVVLLFGYLVSNGKLDFKGVSAVEGGDSVSVRLDMWQETWQMLKTRPILGAGLAGYQSAVQPFHQKDYIEIYLYPHNIILNFWSELGIWGLIAFGGIIVWFYYTGFHLLNKQHDKYIIAEQDKQKGRAYSVILLAAMTVILVHGLVDVPYFKNDLSVMFWLLVSLMIILRAQDDREKLLNKV